MKIDALIPHLDIKDVIESPLDDSGRCLGWHTVITTQGGIVGGGINVDKNISRRIAVAEVLERKYFREIAKSNERVEFLIDEFPTTCGFAAGFDVEKTRFRALSEAVERWIWSKWIDQGYYISGIEVLDLELTEISKYFVGKFDKVLFFKKRIVTDSISNFVPSVSFGAVIAIKDGGVFPGSRVVSLGEDAWEHGLVEAYRHLLIFNNKKNNVELSFPFSRIVHFGSNMREAIRQINQANKPVWPSPELLVDKRFYTPISEVVIHRALMKDFIGWERGHVSRFVY